MTRPMATGMPPRLQAERGRVGAEWAAKQLPGTTPQERADGGRREGPCDGGLRRAEALPAKASPAARLPPPAPPDVLTSAPLLRCGTCGLDASRATATSKAAASTPARARGGRSESRTAAAAAAGCEGRATKGADAEAGGPATSVAPIGLSPTPPLRPTGRRPLRLGGFDGGLAFSSTSCARAAADVGCSCRCATAERCCRLCAGEFGRAEVPFAGFLCSQGPGRWHWRLIEGQPPPLLPALTSPPSACAPASARAMRPGSSSDSPCWRLPSPAYRTHSTTSSASFTLSFALLSSS
mmetsp:Transcript_38865/g.123365  ORF Transcript_38865/g.123365 Transcript_38865/m.123365 type:complete len:296 (-) Transcript_38865:684-1571(-)